LLPLTVHGLATAVAADVLALCEQLRATGRRVFGLPLP
jgi:hypothetical protein